MEWNADRISTLEKLWAEGKSGGEIGKALGITKSSAIGKAHRLGLPPRASPIKNFAFLAERHLARTTPPKPRTPNPSLPTPYVPPNPAERYKAMGIEHKPCEYPMGERREFKICGEDRVVGKPYCAEHCATSYVRIVPKSLREAAACPSP